MSATRSAPCAPVLLRTALRVLFLARASVRLFVFGSTGASCRDPGTPEKGANAATASGIAGGTALIVGACTRAVARVLPPQMRATVCLMRGAESRAFFDPGGGWQFPRRRAAGPLTLALFGDGAPCSSRGMADRAAPVRP